MLAKSLLFQIHTDIKFWKVLLKIPHGTSTTRKCSAIQTCVAVHILSFAAFMITKFQQQCTAQLQVFLASGTN
jgi:hypothetical protein